MGADGQKKMLMSTLGPFETIWLDRNFSDYHRTADMVLELHGFSV